MILTAETIEDYKVHTFDRISTEAEYRLGTTWYKTTVQRKERMKDGRVAAYIPVVPHSSASNVLTGVRLYNVNTGRVWAEKTGEQIPISGINRSVLYRITFDVKESEV